MQLIIVNGLPGTGKTTLARPLSAELQIPLIAKDTVKEFLFDQLGVKDRAWSSVLGRVTNDFLYELAGAVLEYGQSIMIENAFEVSFARPQFERIIAKHHPVVVEVYCTTDPDTRRRRFIDRNESGKRHPGHIDHVNYTTDGDPEPYEKCAPLEVGELFRVDTTGKTDIRSIAQKIRACG